MSKKKWLAAILLVVGIAYTVYSLNLIPLYTNTVDTSYRTVLSWFGYNPVGTAGTALTLGASVVGLIVHIRQNASEAVSNVQENARELASSVNNANAQLQSKIGEMEQQYQTVTGQLTATQSELESTKATLTTTQKQLADANSQLQRKQDQINAVTQVKAQELKTANTTIKLQDALKQLDQNVGPAAAKRILETQGIHVIVE